MCVTFLSEMVGVPSCETMGGVAWARDAYALCLGSSAFSSSADGTSGMSTTVGCSTTGWLAAGA